jgi:hypothetical protein
MQLEHAMALRKPLETFEPTGAPAVTVQVRFLPECCLWSWEVRRADDGTLVASSWADDWLGYPAPAIAEAAARAWLRRRGGR